MIAHYSADITLAGGEPRKKALDEISMDVFGNPQWGV
jgi:hypothetical protein